MRQSDYEREPFVPCLRVRADGLGRAPELGGGDNVARDNSSGRTRRSVVAAIVAGLLFTTTASPLLVLPTASASDVGYRDFSYTAPSVFEPTASKPQSKLWFNDGIWWGNLFDRTTEQFHIYSFDTTSQAWSDTGTPIDTRNASLADVLWDGEHLYVASAGPSESVSTDGARVYRFSYDSPTKSYSVDPGFPVTISGGGMEAIVIAKDGTGRLWVTYTQGSQVFVNRTVGSDETWGVPFSPNVMGTSLSPDDISSVIAFNGRVGLMWSNQLDDAIYFATHLDGDPDDVWSASRTAIQGPNNADDHISLKALEADSSGLVFAAVKTSLDDLPNPNPNAPLVMLLVLDLDGNWTSHVFGRIADRHTRPILLIDEEHRQLYFFATALLCEPCATTPTSRAIVYKQTSLDNISFASGLGTTFIQSATDPAVGNPTSTKQNLNSATGLLIEASDGATGWYLHNFLSLGAPGSQAPTAWADSYSTAQDVALDVAAPGVLVNDFDPDGEPITASIVNGAVHGSVDLRSDGSFLYTPDAGYVGRDSFVYTAGDGTTNSTPATVSLTVAGALRGSWQFDGDATDSSGLANDADLIGGPGFVIRNGGSALQLNGSAQYATVADDDTIDIGGPITLAAWVQPARVATQDLVKKAAAGINGYELSLGAAGTVFARLNQASSGDTFRLNSLTPYPVDGQTWMHTAVTYDGTRIRLYVNGVEEASAAGPPSTGTNALPLTLGAQWDGTRALKGALDDVRIYAGALSPVEVAALAGVNAAPSATLSLSTSSPKTAELLTATATKTDPNNEPVSLTWTWQVNGVVKRTSASDTSLTDSFDLSLAGNGDKGDVVIVSVTPNDGQADGSPAIQTATVANSPPEVTSATTTPSAPRSGDTVTVSAAGQDPDGDPVTYSYQWAKNGTALAGGTSSTLDLTRPTNGEGGDSLAVRIVPTDGAAVGSAFVTPPVVVGGIRFVGASSAAKSGTTKVAIGRPAGVAAGDVLIAAMTVRGTQTITAPAGWQRIRRDADPGGTLAQSLYYRVATSGEPASYTWTLSGTSSMAGTITAYRGVDASHVVDASSGQANASATSFVAPSTVTSSSNVRVLAVFGTTVDQQLSPPSQTVERADVSAGTPRKAGISVEVADVAQGMAGGTGNRIATGQVSAISIGQLLALRASP